MTTQDAAPHERLQAWQACFELALAIYATTPKYPKEERYGLAAQTRSAAYSAGANIVEGLARKGGAELARFLDFSVGSLAELGFALQLAKGADILPQDDWRRLEDLRIRAAQLTSGLLRSVRKAIKCDQSNSRTNRRTAGPPNRP